MGYERPKIILTGGHLAPLLSVFEILKKNCECIIVGRKYVFENDKALSLEYKFFSEKNVKFYDVKAGRLQRKFTTKTIPSLLRIPSSLIKSYAIIKKEKPNAVLTFGGYVGLPIATVAFLSGIPVVLHEQTQKVGLTNKLIGKFAKKVCLTFTSSEKYFNSDKTETTGNPLRKEIFISKTVLNIPKNKKILLVMGGSAGSHTVNEYIEFLLPKLLERFVVIHQTGDSKEFKDYERLLMARSNFNSDFKSRYILKKFISPSEIGSYYKRSDVIVCRAGVNTVLELIALKKHAILIPFPYGQKNEQLENAKYYKNTGLGTYVEEEGIDLDKLFNEILNISTKIVSEDFKIAYSNNNAASRIAQVTLSIVK